MKRILLVSCFWLLALTGFSQNQITEYEYWIDDDIANRTTVTISVPADKITIDELMNISSLAEGLHTIGIRFKDNNKVWSNVAITQFKKRTPITNSQQLSTIQYWFDNDIENAVTNTFAATDQLDHSELVDLSSISNGIHLMNYRIKNEDNIWSCVVSKQIIKREVNTQAHQLTTIQYWFDNDITKAVTTSFPSTDKIDSNELIELSDLSEGLHAINVRIKDESNIWSSVASKQFVKRPIHQVAKINQYRYWFNDDIANATSVNIDPTTEQFSFDEMVDVLSIPPGSDQTINYQFKDDHGNWSIPVSDTINRIAVVKAIFTADKTENCGSMTVQFTNNSTDGESYLWDFGDGNTSTEENPNHTYDTSGSFTVSLTTTNNTYSQSDVSNITDFITIHAIPIVDLGADVQICEGSEHTFSIATNFEEYYWNDASGSNEFTTNIDGDYTLRVVDTNGCEASDVANLSFFTAPTVNLGADIQICEGNEHTFSVEDNFVQYFWNDVEGSNELIADAEGDYTLKVADANGCETSDMANLSFFTAPIVDLGVDIQICEGNEHTFSVADEFVQYFWNDVEGTNELIADAEGDYTLKVVDANGCIASDMANLSFFTAPIVDLGVDIQICEGNEHAFRVADEFVQYFWNDVEGSNELIADGEGDYTLRIVDANACEATDVVNLSFHTSPIVDLGEDVTICDGNEHTFSVSNDFAQYFWNDVEGGNELIAETEGDYTLRVVDANACEASDQARLIINDLPVVNLGDDKTACEGEELILSVEDNQTKYFWNNTEGSNQLTVTVAGEYLLRVEDSNGCEASDAVSVAFLAVPVIDLGSDVDICADENFSFTVSDEHDQYFWNDIEGNNTYEVTTSGNYNLKVVGTNGCSSTDEATITIHSLPETPMVTYQDGILSSTYEAEYQWYLNNQLLNGKTSKEFTPEQDGNYSVEVWSEFGCKSQISQSVEVILVGIADILNENMSIYPNPTKDKVVIDLRNNFNHVSTLQLKLLDSSGKLILCKKLEPITTLDLSSYPSGLYFIHFINLKEAVSFKIIKQ